MGLTLTMALAQILDFLAFHPLFGPWAIVIGELLLDVGKFVVVSVSFNEQWGLPIIYQWISSSAYLASI